LLKEASPDKKKKKDWGEREINKKKKPGWLENKV